MKNYNPGDHPKHAKRILLAPLDWGLGHATRCIPIIKELQNQGCDVWLAGNSVQEKLLKQEFPQLPFLPLPGYDVSYAKTGIGFIFRLWAQLPKISRMIGFEHQWLKEKIKEFDFDAVISDNRYGLYHTNIPCVFITHQLQIKSPLGKWSERMIQQWNYHYIKKFSTCWVPDFEEADNIAGELSHPQLLPETVLTYLGPLSRFEKSAAENIHELLIILSGPEPQRSILEAKLIKQLRTSRKKAVIVRGLPEGKSVLQNDGLIEFHNHLSSGKLNELILKSEIIISRCGYSTVMDLMKLQKKSILIPTPGQTEQEYLAGILKTKKMACTYTQKKFDLQKALDEAMKFEFHFPENYESKLRSVILHFLESLETKENNL